MFQGDSRWLLLHVACLDHKTTEGELSFLFALILKSLSPLCSDNLKDFLEENPIPLKCGHHTRFAWSVKLHNHVNVILGKDQISLEDALEIYMSNGWCDLRLMT